MQLESELRSFTVGDLSVHEYFNKTKKIADLLKGIEKKMKKNHVVTYVIKEPSRKFDATAGFIHHSNPFTTFEEDRSMLLVEEHILLANQVPTVSHDNHSSFLSFFMSQINLLIKEEEHILIAKIGYEF